MNLVIDKERKQLLELIKGGLWENPIDCSCFKQCDWNELYELAKIQTVLGVTADGISKLTKEVQPSMKVKSKWIGPVCEIEKQNIKNRNILIKVHELLENHVNHVFMKGETVALRYPNPLRRQSGDIDFVISKEDFQQTLCLLEHIGDVDRTLIHEHHGMVIVEDVVIEPHYKVHNYQYPKNDKTMCELFDEIFPDKIQYANFDGYEIPVFPITFESVFLISHMVNHVYEEGLGLRQVIDYAMFLNSEYPKIDLDLHDYYLERMNLKRAHRIFVRICEEYLGLPINILNYKYSETEIKFADKLMSDILSVGNFGRGKYIFNYDTKLSELNNFLWVAKRCMKLSYLCPTEAYSWPLMKLNRYFMKKIMRTI